MKLAITITFFLIALMALAAPARSIAQERARGGDEPRTAELNDELPELETDRDAFTPATSSVTPGWTVVETSYSFVSHRIVDDTHSFPELLGRIGVTDRIELRVGWNYERGGGGNIVSSDESSDLLPGSLVERDSSMLYGAKIDATRQNGWVPRSCVILEGNTPTMGRATATDLVATYAWGWELPNRWRLDSAFRYGLSHEVLESFNSWMPSVVLRMPLTEKWNVHTEYFGAFSDGREIEVSQSYFSPGTHYLLTPNLEIGVRVGWGLNLEAARFFVNSGLGLRF